MYNSRIIGLGHYVPDNVVTNDDLSKLMDTNDEWIQERTGIQERRWIVKGSDDTSATMGAKAARIAIKRAGLTTKDIDFIVFATLSPDYYFPGCGVQLQELLEMNTVGALDIRNQCSGFVYGLSVADQFVKTGMYKNVLLVGGEMHSMGLDFSTRGRNVTVIFGDGAGAVVLQPTEDNNRGILTTHMHSNGTFAEKLAFISPGAHSGYYQKYTEEEIDYGFPQDVLGEVFVTQKMVDDGMLYPHMEGQFVFKNAVVKFPEVIMEAFKKSGESIENLKLLIPHQANLRISQFVQKRLGLKDEQVWNNIQKYGNTTAASIPIALSEAIQAGVVNKGDLVCLAAFGSGFTWASALIRW